MNKFIFLILLILSACGFSSRSAVAPSDSDDESSGTSEDVSGSEASSGPTGPATSVDEETSNSSGFAEGEGLGSGSTGEELTEESSESDSESTGEPGPSPYAPCIQDEDGCNCVWTDEEDPVGFCAPDCNAKEDCPDLGGSTTPWCTYYCGDPAPLVCALRCDNGALCPEGMECVSTLSLPECDGEWTNICMWK